MPLTMFGTVANSAIVGGIRIIIRYGISWICSARPPGRKNDRRRIASDNSLRTKTFNKFAVRKDSKYINSRDKSLAESRNRSLKANRIHKSPCKGGEETFCSARTTLMEKRRTPLASSKSLKTRNFNKSCKLQLAETKGINRQIGLSQRGQIAL